MEIGIAALAFSSFLALSTFRSLTPTSNLLISELSVIRVMLVKENKRLDEDELGGLKGANKERIEEFARLEGISIEEATERKRGFRYLY